MNFLKAIIITVAVCFSAITLASCEHEHTWNSGEITTEPTAEKSGVITYTCTDCGEKKTESIALKTTVTEEEWSAAFLKDNFTITGYVTERDRRESLTMKITPSAIYTENDGYESYLILKEGEWYLCYTEGIGNLMKGVSASVQFTLQSFHAPSDFADYTYDEEARAYKSGSYAVYFENGSITRFDYCEEDDGIVTHSFTFSEYGTTEVDLPYTPKNG